MQDIIEVNKVMKCQMEMLSSQMQTIKLTMEAQTGFLNSLSKGGGGKVEVLSQGLSGFSNAPTSLDSGKERRGENGGMAEKLSDRGNNPTSLDIENELEERERVREEREIKNESNSELILIKLGTLLEQLADSGGLMNDGGGGGNLGGNLGDMEDEDRRLVPGSAARNNTNRAHGCYSPQRYTSVYRCGL